MSAENLFREKRPFAYGVTQFAEHIAGKTYASTYEEMRVNNRTSALLAIAFAFLDVADAIREHGEQR